MSCGPLIVLQYLGAKGRSAGPQVAVILIVDGLMIRRRIGEQTGDAAMRQNKIKQMWKANKCPTLGCVSVSHGLAPEVMARQGFDAPCPDRQHATSDMP